MKLLFLQESPMYEALGIHALSGCVKGAGHEVDLLIESEESRFFEKIFEIQPDLLGFSFMTRQQEWAIQKINQIKSFCDIPIIIGGTHPTMYPETLEDCDADYLCVGEGEQALVELLDKLSTGQKTTDIQNIHVKIKNKIIKNPIRPLIQDWSTIELPDRAVYHRYPFLGDLPLKRFISSFGCAYKCSFCYINNFRDIYKNKGKFFRRKDPRRVVDEMKATQKDYPLSRIHFVDDIFSLDHAWVKEFLPLFKKEIGVPWTANIWISHMREDVVEFYKDHGCAGLTFGVEAGSEDTRRKMIDKNLPNKIFVENCGYLKKYKIPFHTGNIIGLPGEGLKEAFDTAIFNREIGATSTRAGLFWPFPGTKLTEYAMEKGMLNADYSVKYFNRGVYPIVNHQDSEKLVVMANLFQAVSKWPLFEKLARVLLKKPDHPIVKWVGKLVDQSFWYYEAKFFGVLNWHGVKYWWRLRQSLASMRRHEADPRFKEDFEAQRPFWSMSEKDTQRVVSSSGVATREGLT